MVPLPLVSSSFGAPALLMRSANQYKSDYDILIIVSQKELADRAAYWAKAEERLIRAYTIEKTLRTPVNFIVHSLHEVNDGLAQP